MVVPKPREFIDLAYAPAQERARQEVEHKFAVRDYSYVLSLLDYGLLSLYGRDLATARRAFTAGYKIDEGQVSEAAKMFQWLVVDSRKVYRLTKRERELCHFYLGLAYLLAGDLTNALVEFKKLRQLDQDASRLPVVNFYLGLLYEKLGKWDDARIEYNGLREMAADWWYSSDSTQDSVVRLGRAELVVHVDQQDSWPMGPIEVWVADTCLATLPPAMDSFAVKLTPGELTRKTAQKVSAKASRLGIRLLLELLTKNKELGNNLADLALGREAEDRETRAWDYAPVGITVVRLPLPQPAAEVKLVFYNRAAERLGSAVYPLNGPNARASYVAGMYFIVTGLADEFFVY